MRTFFVCVKSDFRQQIRQRQTLFWMMIFPLVLIIGLGTMLGAVFSSEVDLPEVDVAYVASGDVRFDRPLEQFLADEGIASFLSVRPYGSGRQARAAIDEQKADVILFGGEEIRLLHERSTSIEVQVLKVLLDRYVQAANTELLLLERDLPQAGPVDLIDRKSFDLTSKTPSAIEYFTVTISAMTALFGGMYVTSMFSADQAMRGSYLRVQVAPISLFRYRLAGTISRFSVVLLQLVVIFTVSHFIYRSFDLGRIRLDLLVLALAGLALYGISFGFLMSSLPFRNADVAGFIVNGMTTVLLLLSGGYVPGLDRFVLSRFPFAHDLLMPLFMREGMFQVFFDGDKAIYRDGMLLLTLHITVFALISAVLFRWKGGGRHVPAKTRPHTDGA